VTQPQPAAKRQAPRAPSAKKRPKTNRGATRGGGRKNKTGEWEWRCFGVMFSKFESPTSFLFSVFVCEFLFFWVLRSKSQAEFRNTKGKKKTEVENFSQSNGEKINPFTEDTPKKRPSSF
jgi:hypothetical protein